MTQLNSWYTEALSQQCRTSKEWTRGYADVDQTLVLVSKIFDTRPPIASVDPYAAGGSGGDHQ
jgi:hypothetical protein